MSYFHWGTGNFINSTGCAKSYTIEALIEAPHFCHRPKWTVKEQDSKPA